MLSLFLVLIIAAIIFLSADYIMRVIGEKGSRALTRVMGLLVAAFAVQYILDGIALYFHL